MILETINKVDKASMQGNQNLEIESGKKKMTNIINEIVITTEAMKLKTW